MRSCAHLTGAGLRTSHAVDRPGLQKLAEQAFEGRRSALVALDPGSPAKSWRSFRNPRSIPTCSSTASTSKLAPPERVARPSADQPAAVRHLSHRLDLQAVRGPGRAGAWTKRRHRPCPIRLFRVRRPEISRNAGGAAYGMTDMHRAIVVSSDTYSIRSAPRSA